MPEVKRDTAILCHVKDIQQARYVKNQGWEPNYIRLGGKKVSRVNIAGVIINRDNNQYTLDDQTGKITIMVFGDEDHLKDFQPGKLVRVIGKPRMNDDEKFLVPEIIKEIENPRWIEYRKKRIALQNLSTREEPIDDTPTQTETEMEQPTDYSTIIIEKVKELDGGDGAPFEEVKEAVEGEDIEDEINQLINEGELFELKPGMLKPLD